MLLKYRGADAVLSRTLSMSSDDTPRGIAFRHADGDGENCQEGRDGVLEPHDVQHIPTMCLIVHSDCGSSTGSLTA